MTERQQRVLLLGAAFDTGNMGVGALAAASVRVLHARFPHARISLLDYARTPGVHEVDVGGSSVPVDTVNLRFSWKIFLPNNILVLLLLAALCRVPLLRRLIAPRNRWIRAITEARTAFAISGGDSFSDIYGLGRFFYVALPQILVLLLRTPLVLLPQTIGPFSKRLPTAIAAGIMRRALCTHSRDEDGIEVARRLAGDTVPVRFCHDVAFALEPRPPRQLKMAGPTWEQLSGKVVVGLNVSGLLMMGSYDGRNMFSLKVDYRDLVDALVRHFCSMPGTAVVLVPHVFSADAEGDQAACREVFDRHSGEFGDRLACIESRHDQHEIKHLIGRCNFFLGARMHACIGALSQGIPAIGIAYSRKFAGVLASVGARDLVVDPRQSILDEILATVDAKFAGRHGISARLQATMPEVRRNVMGMLDGMA